MNTTNPQRTTSRDQLLLDLAIAALQQLGYQIESGPRVHTATPDESRQDAPPRFDGRQRFQFSMHEAAAEDSATLTYDSPLWRWITEQLTALQLPLSATPIGDPQAVHEFSGKLLAQYQVDGGSVHLAGCRIKAYPFVRLLSFTADGQRIEAIVPADGAIRPGERFMTALIEQLHLNDWDLTEPPRHYSQRLLADVFAEAASATSGLAPDGESMELAKLPTTSKPLLIAEWCHRASGKFDFEIGDATLSVTFDDWARHLKTPPIICPVTSEPTYHLAITADGRLIAAEQLAACEVCHQRLPRPELAASTVSGKLACREHIMHCPMTGDALLEDEHVKCPTTGLSVAPAGIRDGQTSLLDELEPIDASETTLARLRLDHPRLDRYGSWQLARGAEIDLYVGRKLLGNVLAAVRRDTGELLAAAARGKVSRIWTPWDQLRPKD